MLLAMNLQQSLAAGPRIRLELAGVPELYTEISVRSFETFFLWRGQLDEQSIRRLLDEVCSWLMLVKRAHGPLGRRGEAVPGPTHISEKTRPDTYQTRGNAADAAAPRHRRMLYSKIYTSSSQGTPCSRTRSPSGRRPCRLPPARR